MPYKAGGLDKYWQLTPRYEIISTVKDKLRRKLEQAGCYPPKSAKRDELVDLLLIKETRFIGYDDCPVEDLQKFAVDRGLITSNVILKKDWLVEKLLQADKERTFGKIMDLFPELRLRIYDFYLDGMKRQPLQTPSQPPLARVNQIIRQELIPVFYHQCTFEISLTQLSSTGKLRLADLSYIFLRSIPTVQLGYIRRLSFKVAALRPAVRGFTFEIDLEKAVIRLVNLDVVSGDLPDTFKAAAYISEGVRKIVQEILRRQGRRLLLDDFYELRSRLEGIGKALGS